MEDAVLLAASIHLELPSTRCRIDYGGGSRKRLQPGGADGVLVIPEAAIVDVKLLEAFEAFKLRLWSRAF